MCHLWINQAISFGSIFGTAPRPTLDSWNKKGTMFLICSYLGESSDVEDVCGRSRCSGVDYAVCRDDCGLGAADPPALTWVEGRAGQGSKRASASPLQVPLGKRRMAGSRRAFRVDSASPTHHHWSWRVGIRRSFPDGLTIAPIHDARALKTTCPTPDSFISTFIRPIRC